MPASQLTAARLGCGLAGGAPGSPTTAQPAAGTLPQAGMLHAGAAHAVARPALGTGAWDTLLAKTLEEQDAADSAVSDPNAGAWDALLATVQDAPEQQGQ